jgi:RNA polymerase sigma-70 factor (ECF subfamily)
MNDRQTDQPRQWFATTHWSAVIQAAGDRSGEARAAREELCRTYWPPLYGYVRRCGKSAPEAEDLVQGFFLYFLSRDLFAQADPQRGRFRSFLLGCFKRFLSDESDRARALKRGGQVEWISLDLPTVEAWCVTELPATDSPEAYYDQRWAVAVLRQAMVQMETEYRRSDQEHWFATLKPFISQGEAELSYAEAADRLGLSLSAVKSAILRMRRRYRETIREEVAKTLVDPAELDQEIRHLIGALGT